MPGGSGHSGGSARSRRPEKERRWTQARGSGEVQGAMGSRRGQRLPSRLGQHGDERGVAVEPGGVEQDNSARANRIRQIAGRGSGHARCGILTRRVQGSDWHRAHSSGCDAG